MSFHGELSVCVEMLECREGNVEWRVSRALAAGGVKGGDVGLHVGRHYSIRDLITWCKRMQVSHLTFAADNDWTMPEIKNHRSHHMVQMHPGQSYICPCM